MLALETSMAKLTHLGPQQWFLLQLELRQQLEADQRWFHLWFCSPSSRNQFLGHDFNSDGITGLSSNHGASQRFHLTAENSAGQGFIQDADGNQFSIKHSSGTAALTTMIC